NTIRRIPYEEYDTKNTIRRIPYEEYDMKNTIRIIPYEEYDTRNTIRRIRYEEYDMKNTIRRIRYESLRSSTDFFKRDTTDGHLVFIWISVALHQQQWTSVLAFGLGQHSLGWGLSSVPPRGKPWKLSFIRKAKHYTLLFFFKNK
ncbi:hypothetical protein BD770DRAFT_398121, partial [Pilaira anomala]